MKLLSACAISCVMLGSSYTQAETVLPPKTECTTPEFGGLKSNAIDFEAEQLCLSPEEVHNVYLMLQVLQATEAELERVRNEKYGPMEPKFFGTPAGHGILVGGGFVLGLGAALGVVFAIK